MKGQFLKERIKSVVVAILMLPAGAFLVYGGLGFDISGVEDDGERSWFLVIVGVLMLLYGAFAVWNAYWGVNEDVERNKRYSMEAEEKIKASRAAIDSFRGQTQQTAKVASETNKAVHITASMEKKAVAKVDQSEPHMTKPESNNKIPVNEIKELKELLDENVITQAEFDEKKRQLLGL